MSVSTQNSSPSLISPMAIPATGVAIGTPASSKARMPPQTVAIEEDPFDSRMSETTRIVYGKDVFGGEHRGNSSLGQGPVPDFTPARAAQGAGLADAERREIVVEHETLRGFPREAFHALLVFGRAQSDSDQGLRFAPGEKGRTVGSRQDPDFGRDRPDLIEIPAIRSALLLENLLSED